MRLIIKDYLAQLKEKDELDLLLCDLLLQMGYTTDNRPQSGNRQHGVDIQAHSAAEIILCVVKQGNLTRNNWDVGPNAVRPSLNEIQDTYIRLNLANYKQKKLRIIIAMNGMCDEAVRADVEGYIKRQNGSLWENRTVEIDLWNIDAITDLVQKHLLDEHMFTKKVQTLLRRALYFIEESDYRREYFEHIVDMSLAELTDDDKRAFDKKLAGLHLACQMIAHYAAEAGIFKVGIWVSEYLIIRYWKWLLTNGKLGKQQYVQWLYKFLNMYEQWNQAYFQSVKYCGEEPDRIPYGDIVENRVTLYEVLGFLSTYAYYLSYKTDRASNIRCQEVLNSMVSFINNYPALVYPPYDRHVGIISMMYRLLLRLERTDDIRMLMERQCMYLLAYYRREHKYPVPTDCFEDATRIHLGLPVDDYNTSAFWGTMVEWIILMDCDKLYNDLIDFLREDLSEVTKCAWFLRAEEELNFYDPQAMNRAGEGTAFEPEDTFEEMKDIVEFVLQQYEQEEFSFEEYCFKPLELITCRYYNYLPRVKLEKKV